MNSNGLNVFKCCFAFLLLIFVTLAYTPECRAINVNSKSLSGLAQTYGFVLGQDFTLGRIKEEFPDIRGDADLRRAQFEAAFPRIKEKLETELKRALGEAMFSQVAGEIRKNIQQSLASQQLDRSVAQRFVDSIGLRARGEVESPVLEYLLSVKYAPNPVAEFSDGYRQRFVVDGKGKSQGIKMSMQLPRSWRGKDGERPHVVQAWTSENGTGLETILLLVKDAEGYEPSKREAEELVASGAIKESVPEGATFLAAGNFSIEGRPGYWLKMTMTQERAGSLFFQYSALYQFFFHGKAITIMCTAGGAPTSSERIRIKQAFDRLLPLCSQVLNSVVLPQLY